jgi:hypothetical protein
MSETAPDVLLLDHRIEPSELARLVNLFFGDGCIEYTSLINIRPAQGNRSMLIADPAVRERVREITFALLGTGDHLP